MPEHVVTQAGSINMQAIPLPKEPSFKQARSSFASIWASIMLRKNNSVRTVMFNGTTLGDGTSTLAQGFAAFLAQEYNHKVLLVDFNIGHQSAASGLPGTDNLQGLTSFFGMNQHLKDLIYRTSIPNLSLLPMGKPIESFQAGNFLSSMDKLDHLADFFHKNYDITIFDTLPVTTSPWSISLAKKIDSVILVCRYASSRREVAQLSVDLLQENGVTVDGVILNDRKFPVPPWIYNSLK